MKTVEFGSLFHFIRNGMNIKQDKSGEGLPITRIETIADARVDSSRVGYAGLKESDCLDWMMEPGDILFSHINSVEHIGKCAVYHSIPEKLVHGMNLLCLRCDTNKLLPEFAKYLIRSPAFRSRLYNFINKAVNQASVSIGNLKTIPVSVPSLDEQKRIADILDRAEALQAKRRVALAQLDELAQSIFIEMFGDPVINPMSWNTKKLEKLCLKIFGGGTPSKSRPEYYEGNIPWVTPKDMKQDFIQDSIDHISSKAIEESSTKLVPSNSLLMVIRSGILKKKLPVAINTCEVTINQDMKSFLFDNKLTNSYFMLYFFKIYQRELLNRVRSVTADNLEFNQIKEINVIVPPIEKQQIFALCVAAIEKLKASHNTSLAELDELFASLQYRAFKGELSMIPKTNEQSFEGVKI